MSADHHGATLWAIPALVLWLTIAGRSLGQAQPPRVAVRAVAVPALAMAPAQAWPDEQFERWVFQRDANADAARRRFDSLLTLHIDEIDRACHLSDAQRAKLQLTGRGDVKRFFDGFEQVKHQFNLIGNDVNRLQEIMPAVTPLQSVAQTGLFHSDSLLMKVLRNTLTPEQYAQYQVVAQDRRAYRHRAQIELAVNIIEQSMPLRDAQRHDLIELLAKETKPAQSAGQYDYYLIMERISKIPDEKIKPLFTNPQWKVLERQVNQYKGVVPNLRMNGLVIDDDDDPPAKD